MCFTQHLLNLLNIEYLLLNLLTFLYLFNRSYEFPKSLESFKFPKIYDTADLLFGH